MVKKIVLSVAIILAAGCLSLFAQSRQVSGTVTGADGAPIAGATVVVEGTTTGTTTDAAGRFSVTAPIDAHLNVSFIGYKEQSVSVAGKTALNIVLIEGQEIDDVVIMGYGSGRKVGTVIGSVDQVKAEKIENRPSNNVMDAMQGQVAGLQISTSNGELNTASTIRIHGMGSLGTDDTPLILLDGAPISANALMSMNQNDIEAISVLKDASATSIYGSRAANGVIYVTTKKGMRGSDDVDVTLRASYSMSNLPALKTKPLDTNRLLGYNADYMKHAYPEYYTAYRDMFSSDIEWANELFFGFDTSVNTDWLDLLTKKNAPLYQVDLSVAGGSKKTAYYFSANYSDQEGILPGSAMSRYTFRANVDTRATKWMKLGMNLGIGYSDSSTAATSETTGGLYTSNIIMAAYMIPSYQRATNEDGSRMEFLDVYGDANPLVNADYNPMKSNRLQLNGAAFIELNPVKGLTLRSNLSATAFDYRYHEHFSPKWPTAGGETGSGTAQESFQRSYEWTWTNTGEYRFDIADDHHFTVLVGHESIYGSGESFAIGTKGLTNDKYMTINQGTEIISLPTYTKSQYSFNSVFGRVEYDYANRYFIDGLVRNDACSRFGRNNRNAIFWAAGAMWKISNEAFLKDNKVVSDLSLKVSYGTQGNSGIDNYNQYEYLAIGASYDGVHPWLLSNVGNPSLAWEKQSSLSIGANIEFLKKISLEIEWYRRQTTDMLMAIPKAPSAGVSSVMGNVGAMRNSGIDITLNYDIFRNKNWAVNFYATFNYNRNQLTKLWSPDLKESPYGDMMQYKVGRAFPNYWMPEWRGVNPETGEGQWTAEDGGITNDFNEAAIVDMNKTLFAPYTGGFGVSVVWKGIGLVADFSWAAGNYMVNNQKYFSANADFSIGYNQIDEVLDYWKQPGDKTRFPSMQFMVDNGGRQFDSSLLEDASYLRLKNIQLSYTFPASLLQKSGFIRGVKLYVGARNLFTATKYTGMDPEVTENVFDTDIYPNSRQWTFGLELKF